MPRVRVIVYSASACQHAQPPPPSTPRALPRDRGEAAHGPLLPGHASRQAVKKMLLPELSERASARSLLDSPLFAGRKPAAPKQTLGLGRAAGDATLAQQIPQQPQQKQPQQIPLQQQPQQQQPQQAYAPQHQNPPAQRPQGREREAPVAAPPGGKEVEDLCGEADKYQQIRDYERAERCFRKALAINPKHCRSLCNYAYMLHVGATPRP
mmetsp:Transcript_37522/g.91204  ORF Transcript_37522/g.91204 Transcript_37522/m.91204 type:complete len:210 (-) Transcript_37522:417-1046(-)